MKNFSIVSWFCRKCGWLWQVLSVIQEVNDACPECKSLVTLKIPKNKNLFDKTLGLK